MRLIATVPRVFPCPASAIKIEFSFIIFALELDNPNFEIISSVYVTYFLCTSPDDNHGTSLGSQYSETEVLGVPPAAISAVSETLRCSQSSLNPLNLTCGFLSFFIKNHLQRISLIQQFLPYLHHSQLTHQAFLQVLSLYLLFHFLCLQMYPDIS